MIIIFGLYNIKTVIQNLACTFFSPIEVKKICLKARKKLSLVIYVRCICIIISIFFCMQFLKGQNISYQEIEGYGMNEKYTKSNNIHFFAIIVEFDRMMIVIVI